MLSTSLSFAKIVANPEDNAWAQAYNAGSMFVVIALQEEDAEQIPLREIGKEFFNQLEAEFFGLEEKNLKTIENAIQAASKSLRPNLALSLSLAFFKDNLLYVFVQNGAVVMKRGHKTGVLLQNTLHDNVLLAASGVVQKDDTLLLMTDIFKKTISQDDLHNALEAKLPSDIAEALSLKIHVSPHPLAAAIILNYHGLPLSEDLNSLPNTPPPVFTPAHNKENFLKPFLKYLQNLPKPNFSTLKKKTVFALLIVVLLVILGLSAKTVLQNKNEAKLNALFQNTYPDAQKNYDEGESLLSLNKDLARTSFLNAEKILLANKNSFPPKSSKRQKIESLFAKVQKALAQTDKAVKITPVKADASQNGLLNVLKTNPSAKIAEDQDNFYVLKQSSIEKITKNSQSKTVIIKNQNSWSDVVGLSVFLGNLYVLDKQKGLLKFTPNQKGFTQDSYFGKNPPSFQESQGLAIDGAVYLLFQNGAIKKYLKGDRQPFATTLSQTFEKPSALFTNDVSTNLYVLDTGKSQITVLGKDGSFKKAYQANLLRDASFFKADEKMGKIYFFAKNSLWQIPF